MIPMELLSMAGGATMGHVFKMMSAAQEAKQKQNEMMMKMMEAKTKEADADAARATASADAAAARVGSDSFAKMTRRIFVLSMIALGAWSMLGGLTGLDIYIPQEVTSGFNFLGLIDTTSTNTEWIKLSNALPAYPWLSSALLASASFYLGKS